MISISPHMNEEAAKIRATILRVALPAGFAIKLAKHLDEWISRAEIPDVLRDYLRHCTSSAPFDLGPYSICSLQWSYSFAREHSLLTTEGVIAVATAGNGDVLVCHSKQSNCPVGILSHEGIWEAKNSAELFRQILPVSSSLACFFESCASNADLPGDFHVAKSQLK